MATSPTIQVLAVLGNDEVSCGMYSFISNSQGMTIADKASTEVDALKCLTSKNIDVVLLDLSVREVNGIELTEQIRERFPTVRVLISTASMSPEDIFAAMDAGADGYVLSGNNKGLELAIRSVKLGTVWLDPGIATQVLDAMVAATSNPSTRVLQTGMLCLPLLPDDKALLSSVAASSCSDGVCMVDPSFVRKLRRFAPSQEQF
ncbi:MAG: response regulator transcription factor [Candidatus Melainabacteria bacterium]|nr:response regulator transcription factor [Candidatus Melainabacteria bacterium]